MKSILLFAFVLTAIGCNESHEKEFFPSSDYIGTWEEPADKKIKFELQKERRAKIWVDGELKSTSIWEVDQRTGFFHVIMPFIPQEETWIFSEKRPGIFRHVTTIINETTNTLSSPLMIIKKIK